MNAICDNVNRPIVAEVLYHDSKALSERERERLFEELTTSHQVEWAVSFVSEGTIDAINIRQATLLAMKQAVEKLTIQPHYVLIDGRDTLQISYSQKAVIKGDRDCLSISAASIIAKVSRDRYMMQLAERYPEYDFQRHKGYGTAKHIEAIKRYGITIHHRRSFDPISSLMSQSNPIFYEE